MSSIIENGYQVIYVRAFRRGGNWNNTSNAGVLALNLNNTPSNTNTNIGFRVGRDNENGPICIRIAEASVPLLSGLTTSHEPLHLAERDEHTEGRVVQSHAARLCLKPVWWWPTWQGTT